MTKTTRQPETADALRECLTSANVPDANLEPANLVDVVASLADSTRRVSEAITAVATPGQDAAGGTVACLTEAVMGVTAGLQRIADSIFDLAEAVRERGA